MNARMNFLRPLEHTMVSFEPFAQFNSAFFLLDTYHCCFLSQLIIICQLMMTRKTLGTGLNVSEENTLIKNMLKLKDSQGPLLVGKNGAKNKREKRRKAIKSCTKGCRRSTRSTWLELHVKRKRRDRERSVGTRRGAPLRSTALLHPASQN